MKLEYFLILYTTVFSKWIKDLNVGLKTIKFLEVNRGRTLWQKEFIFGSGGGLNTAVNLETELLAQIPINQPKYHQSLYEIDEEIGQIYDDLVDDLIFRLNIK